MKLDSNGELEIFSVVQLYFFNNKITLPWPKEVYSISVDHDNQQIVLRTSNKKYFKRIDIPEMKKMGLKLEPGEVSWKYSSQTLVIGYTKPDEIIKIEQEKIKMLTKSDGPKGKPEDGSVQCNQQ